MILLDDLAEPLSCKAPVDMRVLLRAANATTYVAKGMLRMVKPTPARLEAQLPKEARDLLDEFESIDWDNADYRRSSAFPKCALEENLSPEDSFEMGDLLKKFESQAKLRVWE